MIKKIYTITATLTFLCSNLHAMEEADLRSPPRSPIISPSKAAEGRLGAIADSGSPRRSPSPLLSLGRSEGSRRTARRRAGGYAAAGGMDAWERASIGTAYTVSEAKAEEIRAGITELRNLRSGYVTAAYGLEMEDELVENGYMIPDSEGGYGLIDDRKIRKKQFPPALLEAIMNRAGDIGEELEGKKEEIKTVVAKARKAISEIKEREKTAREEAEAAKLALARMRSDYRKLQDQLRELNSGITAEVARRLAGERSRLRGGASVLSPQPSSEGVRPPRTPVRSAKKGASPTKDRLRRALQQEREQNAELSSRLASMEAIIASASVLSPSVSGNSSEIRILSAKKGAAV